MNKLKNYAKRIFIITENVRDEFILSDTSCVQLDHYLHIYLKKQLNYDSVVFLDAKGLYYFDNKSRNVLNNNKKIDTPDKKGLSKLKRHNKKIIFDKSNEIQLPDADTRLRYTYDGDIVEISQFILSHLRENKTKFAFVVYDGSLFEKLPHSSDIWVQMQGMLRNEIYALPSSNRNIFIWVDGEEYETLSRRFSRLGFDFLFAVKQLDSKHGGCAEMIRVPTACKDEIQRAVSLYSLKSDQIPAFEDVIKYAPVIAGIMRQKQETLKTFNQYLTEKKDFISHIKDYYGLKSEKQTAFEQLNEMIGLDSVKKDINNLVKGIEKKEISFKADFKLTPERFKIIESASLPYISHLALLGNPGTGKTTVARLIGKILREEGILESGHLVELSRENLVGGYSGQTAIKTKKQVQKALGGILFLDEAYSLVTGEQDTFGKESLGELVKAMSDYQGQFMMIFAGYKNETEQMLKYNPGCARRVQHIDLQDYSAKELEQIMNLYLKKKSTPVAQIDQKIIDQSNMFCRNLLANRKLFGGNHFGNADVVEKQVEKACQEARAQNSAVLEIKHFEHPDFFEKMIKDSLDLDELIGLNELKKQLKILFKRTKIEKVKPGHYIFQGNPGTGKTEVAKHMAKKFYEIDLLKSAKLNYYTASELIGGYVGETENRVVKILNESLGGVLFIDEAHQLVSGNTDQSYGGKALQTIVPFMEDKRKDFCLIFAGYPKEMQKLFQYDPGLKGRFRKIFNFDDYSSDELAQIFFKMFKNESVYKIEDITNDLLRDTFEKIRNIDGSTFSNARMVRNFISKLKNKAIEHAKSNQSTIIIRKTDIEKVCREWE